MQSTKGKTLTTSWASSYTSPAYLENVPFAAKQLDRGANMHVGTAAAASQGLSQFLDAKYIKPV
jgi:hypothetical protein